MTKKKTGKKNNRVSKEKVRQLMILLLLLRSPLIHESGFGAMAKLEEYESVWGEYYPDVKALLMQKISRVGENESWHNWAIDQLRQIMRVDEVCSTEAVRYAVRLYLKVMQLRYYQYGAQDEAHRYPLTPWVWTQMGNAVIAEFLYTWMLNQQHMRQSVSEFARYPFGNPLDADALRKYEGETDSGKKDTRYQLLRGAHRDIQIMQRMREIQADEEAEGEAPALSDAHDLPYTTLLAMDFIANCYTQDRRSEEEKNKTYLENRKRGKEINCFRIFKKISQKKEPLPNESHDGSNMGIAAACADYRAVLDQIAEWEEPAVNGDRDLAFQYVVGTLMAKEWEEAFRLHFASAFAAAERRKGPQKQQEALESETAQELLGRSVFTLSHSIMDYREDLRHICSAPNETIKPYLDRYRILAGEKGMLHSILWMLWPPPNRPVWSEADYLDAAQFFSRQYNIIKKLRGIDFPPAAPSGAASPGGKRRGKDHYDRMRKYYDMINKWRILSDPPYSSPHETYKIARKQLFPKKV